MSSKIHMIYARADDNEPGTTMEENKEGVDQRVWAAVFMGIFLLILMTSIGLYLYKKQKKEQNEEDKPREHIGDSWVDRMTGVFKRPVDQSQTSQSIIQVPEISKSALSKIKKSKDDQFKEKYKTVDITDSNKTESDQMSVVDITEEAEREHLSTDMTEENKITGLIGYVR